MTSWIPSFSGFMKRSRTEGEVRAKYLLDDSNCWWSGSWSEVSDSPVQASADSCWSAESGRGVWTWAGGRHGDIVLWPGVSSLWQSACTTDWCWLETHLLNINSWLQFVKLVQVTTDQSTTDSLIIVLWSGDAAAPPLVPPSSVSRTPATQCSERWSRLQ